jgi:hypothetical protein
VLISVKKVDQNEWESTVHLLFSGDLPAFHVEIVDDLA